MVSRLPSLRALQIFDAAARARSFKQAAIALNLSATAVSRQLQTLEEQLGAALFERFNRSVALTNAGEALHARIGPILSDLRDAIDAVSVDRQLIRISGAQYFCAEWLLPQLADFESEHPGCTVELSANPTGDDPGPLERREADTAILHGRPEQWPAYDTLRLLPPLSFFPACAPGLIDASLPLSDPEQLRDYPWLINANTPWAWDWYLEQVGAAGLQASKTLQFESYPFYMQALLQGRGIAIAPSLFQPYIAAGRLIQALEPQVPHPDYGYYLVLPSNDVFKPGLTRFRSWLQSRRPATELELAAQTGIVGDDGQVESGRLFSWRD